MTKTEDQKDRCEKTRQALQDVAEKLIQQTEDEKTQAALRAALEPLQIMKQEAQGQKDDDQEATERDTMSTTKTPNVDRFVNHLAHEVRQLTGFWSALGSAATALEAELKPGEAMGHLNAIKFLLDQLAALSTQLDERVGDAFTIRNHIKNLES